MARTEEEPSLARADHGGRAGWRQTTRDYDGALPRVAAIGDSGSVDPFGFQAVPNSRQELASRPYRVLKGLLIEHLLPFAVDRGVPTTIELNEPRSRRHLRSPGGTKGRQDRLDQCRLLGLTDFLFDTRGCHLVGVDRVEDGGDHPIEVVVEFALIGVWSRCRFGGTVDPSIRPGQEVACGRELCPRRGGH